MENKEVENRIRETCCVFGHRTIKDNKKLRNKLSETFEHLICYYGINRFLLGSHSEFDDLCYEVLTDLMEDYPKIKRIYVRCNSPELSEKQKRFFSSKYDGTYYPKRVHNAGRGLYIERNYDMIDNSYVCVVYFFDDYQPHKQQKSGTSIAYKYARRKQKEIINLAERSLINKIIYKIIGKR